MRADRACAGWLLLLLLLLVGACGPAEEEPAAAPTADAQLTADVNAAFATYRAGVAQGDADAVVGSLSSSSVADMRRIADLARDADELTVRALPAAEQLLVLTYRLRPQLLEADDPYAALVKAGFAGQDRSLGDLGGVSRAGDDLALGVVVDATTQTPTPLRWRFRLEDGGWHLDLTEAHRLLSQVITTSANRAGSGVDELVAATIVDLSGEPADDVEALYRTPPG